MKGVLEFVGEKCGCIRSSLKLLEGCVGSVVVWGGGKTIEASGCSLSDREGKGRKRGAPLSLPPLPPPPPATHTIDCAPRSFAVVGSGRVESYLLRDYTFAAPRGGPMGFAEANAALRPRREARIPLHCIHKRVGYHWKKFRFLILFIILFSYVLSS